MRLFSMIAAFCAVLLVTLPVSAAPVFDTPQALLDYAYKPYADGSFPDDPYELYSPGLRQMVDASIARAGEDMAGGLDFDPFIDAQDYDNVRAETGSLKVTGDRAEAVVTVHNFDTTAEITFFLVKSGGGWLIDDIARTDGEYPWRLSTLLADDPTLN